ncbi:MAG: hypothetical protein M3126_02035 [Candidatus Eremiobacteraeota bacterium]|nr:hypothetical protein [Candidatus Eremiobacteraeota bacterium]
MSQWVPVLDKIAAPNNPGALSDVHPLLVRLIDAFGGNIVARMLDVNPSMITRWKSGGTISAEMTSRIIDLHDVFNRAFQIMRPRNAVLWLFGQEPLLNGARPIDVLAVRGVAPVIEALMGIEAGAYA